MRAMDCFCLIVTVLLLGRGEHVVLNWQKAVAVCPAEKQQVEAPFASTDDVVNAGGTQN